MNSSCNADSLKYAKMYQGGDCSLPLSGSELAINENPNFHLAPWPFTENTLSQMGGVKKVKRSASKKSVKKTVKKEAKGVSKHTPAKSVVEKVMKRLHGSALRDDSKKMGEFLQKHFSKSFKYNHKETRSQFKSHLEKVHRAMPRASMRCSYKKVDTNTVEVHCVMKGVLHKDLGKLKATKHMEKFECHKRIRVDPDTKQITSWLESMKHVPRKVKTPKQKGGLSTIGYSVNPCQSIGLEPVVQRYTMCDLVDCGGAVPPAENAGGQESVQSGAAKAKKSTKKAVKRTSSKAKKSTKKAVKRSSSKAKKSSRK
jgi:hypothetical protein